MDYHIGAERSEGKWRKTWQIGEEQEHQGEIEELCQNRKEKCSDNIRAESERSSVEQIKASSLVQKNAELGEYPTG